MPTPLLIIFSLSEKHLEPSQPSYTLGRDCKQILESINVSNKVDIQVRTKQKGNILLANLQFERKMSVNNDKEQDVTDRDNALPQILCKLSVTHKSVFFYNFFVAGFCYHPVISSFFCNFLDV